MLQAVPGQVHQVGDHVFFAGLANIQPPLTGEGHHADEGLGVDTRVLSTDVVVGELTCQQVLDLRGDVDDQAREGTARLRDG